MTFADDLLVCSLFHYYHVCELVGDEGLTDKEIHDRDVKWLTESDGGWCYILIKNINN